MPFLAPALPFIGPAIGIGSALLGGGDKAASSSQSSSNKAFDFLKGTYTPQTANGIGANNFMTGLLGIPGGDTAGSDAGFARYKDMAGYAPALQELQSGITQGAAAHGLLNSGSTQKALVKYGAGLDQQFFNNYFQNLNSLNSQGNTAGQIISGAGNVSSGQSSGAQQGLLGKIGAGIQGGNAIAAALPSIFSDRRLKRDIARVGELDDGLGVYSYRYKWDDEPQVGVMADEVATLRPWALGPVVGGYATVDYGAL